jgi:uncharacterized protein (DUF2336 family)
MLERLTQLTADTSPDGRRRLIHAVTDLFLVDDGPSEVAKEHYADIANHSLDRMASGDRIHYAERVAAEPTLPGEVAVRLAADDDFAVANLVLKLSPVLTDSDLAAIAVTHSQRHLAAIAERASLSSTVTEVLVERGDAVVLRTVSGNEGAEFSDQGMARLIERGGGDPEVAQNLNQRASTLPAAQAQRVLQIAAQATGSDSASRGAPALARHARARRLEVRLLIADIRDRKCTLDEAATQLALEDRAYDLVQVISAFAEIGTTEVLRALLQPDASGIAVLCRSLGMSTEAFRFVLKLRAARLNASALEIEADANKYETLPADVSDRTIRLLKVRTKVS